MGIKDLREAFAASSLPDLLAEQAGVPSGIRLPPSRSRSSRFVWYRDNLMLALVVGAHEGGHVDEALAVGLGVCGERELRLVLPLGWHEPTLHRWAWLRADLPVRVWSHASGAVYEEVRPSRNQTLSLVSGAEKPMLHLKERTAWVEPLMRWAGAHTDLDPAHRQDVRAWQCRGQRVLRIRPTKNGLELLGGIDWGTNSPHQTPTPLILTAPLSFTQEKDLRDLVTAGCKQERDLFEQWIGEQYDQTRRFISEQNERRRPVRQPLNRLSCPPGPIDEPFVLELHALKVV
jgi:hypothetical protein